jgi:hypothetical protein
MSREAEIYIAAPPPSLRPLRSGETPAELASAIGLRRCGECGEFKGTCLADGEEVELLCICDGILCRRCKRNLVRRPISDHFNEADGRVWHTPSIAALIPCAACKEELG